jgi:hypothetical protein
MPTPFPPEDFESRLPRWLSMALETAKERRGPYPVWVTGTIKSIVIIGALTGLADWASHRSAKSDLARLVIEASRSKPPSPIKTGSINR